MEKCLRLPEITDLIFSRCENEELRGMIFIPGLSGGSIEELRKRRKISAKFKLGSLDDIDGEICKKTENVMIKIGGGWSELLANIQLTAVAETPLDINVENGYIFTPDMVRTLCAFELTVKSFTCGIESLTSLSGPLNFNQLDKLKITGREFEAGYTELLHLMGGCQPLEMEVTESFLGETDLESRLCRLRKLKITGENRDLNVGHDATVWRNILNAQFTLEKLQLTLNMSYCLVQMDNIEFRSVKELSVRSNKFGHFGRMSVMFPNLQVLELCGLTHIDSPRTNIWDPQLSLKTLRFHKEAGDLNLASCPNLRQLCPNAEAVEFSGSNYSGTSVYQFFRHNHWAHRVKISGNFSQPNTLSPFNFLQEMIEVRELNFSPSFNRSKIDWSCIRGALCSLPNLRKLSLQQVNNVDMRDLSRFPELRLTSCSVINADPNLVYPNFIACELK